MPPVRVRFAPSPTGFLHVGGARTAIFNCLLRAPPRRRVHPAHRGHRRRALRRGHDARDPGRPWPGSAWRPDEGPFFQSSGRDAARRGRAERLLAAGTAYRCFCTAATRAQRAGPRPRRRLRYPRTCLRALAAEAAGAPPRASRSRVRFRVPDGRRSRLDDLVRGDVGFDDDAIDDFVLLRSDGTPTYNLSVVVRRRRHGDHPRDPRRRPPLEHAQADPALPRAGRHEPPAFGHLPLILGDGQEAPLQAPRRHLGRGVPRPGLSCPRRSSTSWPCSAGRPGDDREMLSRDELVAASTCRASDARAPSSTSRSSTG